MAVPKQKPSKARSRTRRSINMKIKVKGVATCSFCSNTKLPHHVCPKCGYYRDTSVIDIE